MQAVAYIKEEEFDSIITADSGVVVFDFTASWCGPCKMVAPMMDKLAQDFEGTVKVAKVDLDQSKTLAKRLGIRSIPAVMIYKNGNLMETIVGVSPYEKFSDAVKTLL